MVEPICRCGQDRIVSGDAIICEHCDRPCTKGRGNCPNCNQLDRTCTDCRALSLTAMGARRCEETHAQ